jgi:sporulation protein YlmC with PRC-barrel domain
MATDYDDSGVAPITGQERNGGGEYRRVLSAATLTGDRVRNSAGENLGKIEEIMIDVPTGRVAYAVLSFGGFLGIGDKLFAVPWQSLTLNERDHEFILNVDRERLETAPGFDRDHWPDMADPAWGALVNEFYGRGRNPGSH